MNEFTPILTYGEKNYRASGPPTLVGGQKPSGKGNPRCKGCRMRIRGVNHEQGTHHMRRAIV